MCRSILCYTHATHAVVQVQNLCVLVSQPAECKLLRHVYLQTAAGLSVFTLAMTLYPDVMHQAQAQIDLVVGRHRLPTFEDRDKLPYIEAMVKEVLRWRPITPMGFPRLVTQDDWYKGYFIPKGKAAHLHEYVFDTHSLAGTRIMYNVWCAFHMRSCSLAESFGRAMNRDPTYFPDFDEFRPERYLGSSGLVSDTVPDTHSLGHMSFGTGRRQAAIVLCTSA